MLGKFFILILHAFNFFFLFFYILPYKAEQAHIYIRYPYQGKACNNITAPVVHQQFILLGDNTQSDPEIYTAIADKYPGNIAAIYIRNMDTRKEQQAKVLLASVRNKSIHTCLFNQTKEAIAYSKSIGLVT